MRLKQTRTFRARLDQCYNVAAFVESAVVGLEPRVVMTLRLAIEELFVNTITHGHRGDSDAPVEVTVHIVGERVALTYLDTGPPYNPFANVRPPDAGAPLEARGVGGLGVFLITELADRCDYARVGERNCLTVELKTRR